MLFEVAFTADFFCEMAKSWRDSRISEILFPNNDHLDLLLFEAKNLPCLHDQVGKKILRTLIYTKLVCQRN